MSRMADRRSLLSDSFSEFVSTTVFTFSAISANLQWTLNRAKRPEISAFGNGLAFWAGAQLRHSDIHLNPAFSVFAFVSRRIGSQRLLGFLLAQFFGAFFGAVLSFLFYYEAIVAFDHGNRMVTGPMGTASAFVGFPAAHLSALGALIDQTLSSALLFLIMGMITESQNGIPNWIRPLLLGLAQILFSVAFGGNVVSSTGNPARDLAARVAIFCLGYGDRVFGFRDFHWFWIPIVGPILGSLLCGAVFSVLPKHKVETPSKFLFERPFYSERGDSSRML